MFSFDYSSHFGQKVLKVRKCRLQVTVTTSFNLKVLIFKEPREIQISIWHQGIPIFNTSVHTNTFYAWAHLSFHIICILWCLWKFPNTRFIVFDHSYILECQHQNGNDLIVDESSLRYKMKRTEELGNMKCSVILNYTCTNQREAQFLCNTHDHT